MPLSGIRAGLLSISSRLVIETARDFLQPHLSNAWCVLQLDNDRSDHVTFQSIIHQNLSNHSAILFQILNQTS
jgi:hypothetical protein